MRLARSTAAVLALGLGLALAACGGEDSTEPSSGGTSSSAAPTSPSQDSSPSPSVSPTTSSPDTASWPTTDRDWESSNPSRTGVLRAIRTGAHDGYDRVVFELRRPVSGYHVGYVDSVTEDPSDRPVPLEGDAFLQVVVFNATTDNAFQIPPGRHLTYTGPRTLTPGLDQVQQVSVAGDFEATLSFGIGLAAEAGFEVRVLDAPARLVVDIAQP